MGRDSNLQRRNVFVEEDREVGLLSLVFPRLDPARDVGIPTQVSRVDVQDAGPGHGGWRGRTQVGDLEDEPHFGGQRDSLVASQGQDLVVVPGGLMI